MGNSELYLRVLAAVMRWDEERVAEELDWVRLMARYRYDSYRDFEAGAGFAERLADWLQQFRQEDRQTAYSFVKEQLVYVGPGQMRQLVDLAFPNSVQPALVRRVAKQLAIEPYAIWTHGDAAQVYKSLLRKTLFLGLSDGARIDSFRRSGAGVLSNEQVLVGTQIDTGKWDELLGDLRKDLGESDALFDYMVLLDDFTASGKTLIRKNEETGEWKGKLQRLWKTLVGDDKSVLNTHFSPGYGIHVHHYLATAIAERRARELSEDARSERGDSWFPEIDLTFGYVLAEDLPITSGPFFELVMRNDYYDPAILTRSMQVGDGDGRLGFDLQALPLILEHNAPNNSVALLWAETDGEEGHHPMRPLFRRRSRHR